MLIVFAFAYATSNSWMRKSISHTLLVRLSRTLQVIVDAKKHFVYATSNSWMRKSISHTLLVRLSRTLRVMHTWQIIYLNNA